MTGECCQFQRSGLDTGEIMSAFDRPVIAMHIAPILSVVNLELDKTRDNVIIIINIQSSVICNSLT